MDTVPWRTGLGVCGRLALPAIQALTNTLIPSDPRFDQDSRVKVTRALALKINLMPRFLSLAMLVLTVLFDGYGIVRYGRVFHSLTLARRDKIISQWQHAPLRVCRDFVRFYDRMVMFVAYSMTETTDPAVKY